MADRFYGKYRGTVINNIDPLRQGRLQVSCPHVLGVNLMAWAMPCVPVAGLASGVYMMPGITANVWIEFEGGDPDLPIWTGCFWGLNEIPFNATLPSVRTMKFDGIELTLDSTPGAGGITLEAMPPAVGVPASVKLDATGIELKIGAATIKLDPASVNVNNGALEVI